jgi:hypothetical protein
MFSSTAAAAARAARDALGVGFGVWVVSVM